jgi:AraC-like DNA-binding protein/CheY-like chemotaxis protein
MDIASPPCEYHALATAAHRFLLAFEPARADDTRAALNDLCRAVEDIPAPPPLVEAVLLKLIAKLQTRLPLTAVTLSDHLTWMTAHESDPLSRFRACIDHLLECHAGLPDSVRTAISVTESLAADAATNLGTLASQVGLRPTELESLLKRHTGRGFRHLLRRYRIRRSIELLREGPPRIKDVWVTAGYNSASEFDREFKRQVGVAPSRYCSLVRGESEISCVSRKSVHPHRVVRRTNEGAAPQPRSASVLLIDDDAIANALAVEFLRDAGFDPVATVTGEAGLRLARRLDPAVVVVDYWMPDTTGMTLLRRLSEERCRARSILLTGDCTVAAHTRECEALDVRIVYKPVAGDDLVRIVQQRVAEPLAHAALPTR